MRIRAAKLATGALGVLLLLLVPGSVAGPAQDWLVAYGPDIVERTAAVDVAAHLRADHLIVRTVAIGARTTLPPATTTLVIGTPTDNPLTAAADRERSFRLPAQPESYDSQARPTGGHRTIYVAGRSAKGAMDGTFRLEQRVALNGLSAAGRHDAGTPAFTVRAGGDKQSQAPPPGWTEDQQASYYAHNYLNVVWGEKYGPDLSGPVLRKWGLKLATEVRLPPPGGPLEFRKTWAGSRRVVDPTTPAGRQAYRLAFTSALHDHPQTRILYTLFGDYSFAPKGDRNSLAIARILKQAVAGTGVEPMVWMWHLNPDHGDLAFMDRLAGLGIGILYNEDGNGDDWATRRDNFNAVSLAAEDGRSRYGDGYSVLVSAGGSCESLDPAIGIPLPYVAASKIKRLHRSGVRNFFLWWGSSEGWVSSPNIAVIRELIWNPDAAADTVIGQAARAEFGDQANLAIRYWKLVDQTLEALPILSWYQRLGPFTNAQVYSGGKALTPLTPKALGDGAKFPGYDGWQASPKLATDWPRTVRRLDEAVELSRNLGPHDPRFRQSRLWLAVYARLLESQQHLAAALVVREHFSGAELAGRLRPIAEAEITNSRSLATDFRQLPRNANLYATSKQAYHGNTDRDHDLRRLQNKILAMQRWVG